MARKAAEPTIQSSNGNWGSAPHPEISVSNSEPWVAPHETLGFRRQYHQCVNRRIGYTARL
jgi:hypothetical protein